MDKTMSVATIRAIRQVRQWSVFPWIVLAVGILASFSVFFIIRDSVEHVARLRFEREVDSANRVIENRIRFYNDILYGLRAVFATQGPISRHQFRDFVMSLDLKNRYPGFDLVNYAVYVRAKDRKRFEETVRRDTSLVPQGYPQFTI